MEFLYLSGTAHLNIFIIWTYFFLSIDMTGSVLSYGSYQNFHIFALYKLKDRALNFTSNIPNAVPFFKRHNSKTFIGWRTKSISLMRKNALYFVTVLH